MRTGIEPEFFLLRQDGRLAAGARPTRWTRWTSPATTCNRCRASGPFCTSCLRACQLAGWTCSRSTTKTRTASTKLNFAHAPVLQSADRLMLFKLAAHALAEAARDGVLDDAQALCRPAGQRAALPCVAVAGRAARCAQALQTAFIAGVLAHSRGAVRCCRAHREQLQAPDGVSQSLSGTTWAPAVVAHGPNNRTALLRTLPGRFEWRLPDASANPYLASAALIAAGLDGVARRLDPGPAQTDDLFDLNPAELKARGIGHCCRRAWAPRWMRWRPTRWWPTPWARHAGGRVRAPQARRGTCLTRAARQRLGTEALRSCVLKRSAP